MLEALSSVERPSLKLRSSPVSAATNVVQAPEGFRVMMLPKHLKINGPSIQRSVLPESKSEEVASSEFVNTYFRRLLETKRGLGEQKRKTMQVVTFNWALKSGLMNFPLVYK